MAVSTRPAARPLSVAAPRRLSVRAISNTILLVIGLCFLLPLGWLVLASIDESASLVVSVPGSVSAANFDAVLSADQTFRPLWNSFVLSAGCALITVVAAVLAAYPLSRYRMRFNKPFMYGVLFGTGLPITAMMVPVYALFVRLNLLDSLPGAIFFLAATSLPMAIWMMKNFMDSVPVSLEEAAWVDGASAMRALRTVVVPLMRPGIAVVFIFVFIQAWGNFFVPFVLLLSPEKQPAAVSIFTFFGQYGSVAYGQLAAFSLLYSLPVLVLYVLVSRVLGGSFTMAGAVKG
ncbi:carbohydrate ABC transporter permease [Phytoactinopolyspora halotolerans]|uniref:Carbohydrate ABC transporter permease n=1 Tax=Phytoactinopolyspora halotolerans TaxID=1981512 RepID=A0A6L9SDS0_9ACTN|nr:carbohydrate ABC transporter permease [Phytoactinopolyspora halotolerans]NEE02200.1 carbohydrate ABC transporter permease [Phytoactinopolyspora halotolerans]